MVERKNNFLGMLIFFIIIFYLRAFTRSSFKSLMSTFLFPAVIVALLTSQHRQTSYDMAASAVVVELKPRV
jgi:hypothetical protein